MPLRWLLRHHLGLHFSLSMVTEFAPRPHAWRLVSIGIYPWNRAKKRRTKASQYFATLDLIPSNARQECVAIALTICLFSGLRCALLRSDREVRAGTNLCWRYACFFPTSEGSAHHLSKQRSGGCQICQTCSARPAPPALSERNECVKDR